MGYTIKKLDASDFVLARLLMNEWAEEEDPSKLPDDQHLIRLLSKTDFHVFVALLDGNIIGGLTAYELQMFYREEKEMFFYEIGVNEGYQRQGIGKNLIKELKETCHQKGIKNIFVATSLDNEAARSLYLSTGGEEEIAPIYSYDLRRISI